MVIFITLLIGSRMVAIIIIIVSVAASSDVTGRCICYFECMNQIIYELQIFFPSPY